jgi:hypothetical protein
MSQQRVSGDYVVTGLVTGTHIIEDIKVPVPHQIAVRIPAELAHRSKDLWRGLQQNRLFLLKGGSGLSVVTPTTNGPSTAPAPAPANGDSAEVIRLRQELAASRQENAELRASLKAQEGKLEAILVAISKLGQGGPVTAQGVQAAVEAVGGEAPMFFPSEGIKPKDAKTNITVAEDAQAGASVASAANKLRSLKKKTKDD